jgi:hypothetical protein
MSEAAPSAAPTQQPIPRPPPRLAPSVKLANLLSAIICLAHELLATLHTLPRTDIISRFGTLDVRLIVARIKRGLMLAEALDDRIARTARRIDNPPLPRLQPSTSGNRGGNRPRFDRDADDAALLAGLPTAQDIAAQIRRRPIGAVITDICRDLGIAPADRLFPLIIDAVLWHRGNLPALMAQIPVARGGLLAPKMPGKARTHARAPAPLMAQSDVTTTLATTAFPVAERAATGPPERIAA